MINVENNHFQVSLDEVFPLENGRFLPNPSITYHTFGTLNADKSNVIYVCHALTANSNAADWWQGLFGEGDIFDASQYFIICANNLGSPYGTISPKHINPETEERYGLNFPFFTIRDTARLHLRLLEYLKIDRIKLMIGGSCGGNIAQEMAFDLGEKVENLVLLCCSAKESPWAIAIHESQRIVLQADRSFFENVDGAGHAGLKACRAVALPFYRTHESFSVRQKETDGDKIQDFRAASYIDYQGDKFVNRFDTHCYFKLLNALDTHNMGRGRGGVEAALAEIKAKTLVIGFDSDILIPIAEQQFLGANIPSAKYVEIETLFGHDAFLIENEQIRNSIKDNLDL